MNSQKKLILVWIPSRKGVKGNEAQDDLARSDPSRLFVGDSPSFSITKSQIRKSINECSGIGGKGHQDKDGYKSF